MWKSTLLTIISGIDKDYDGVIKTLTDSNNIGYMLQQDALLPWLTIKENCMLGLKIKGIKDETYVNNLIKKYGLEKFIKNLILYQVDETKSCTYKNTGYKP